MITLKPSIFLKYNKYIIPTSLGLGIMLLILGIYWGFAIAPLDYQQLDSVRIMYIHVPCAWLSLSIYFVMGILGFSYIVWRNTLNIYIMNALAHIGMFYAFITLITGSLWGKPMWGTYWVWDSRLTTMFILFLFYIGYNIYVLENEKNYSTYFYSSILAIIGAINVPLVKFSVNLWNSLHQPSSIIRKGGISIDSGMLIPLIIIFFACICITTLIVTMRVEIFLLQLKKNRDYIKHNN